MMRSLLLTVRQLINAYLFLCFIKILLSWVPSAAYSSFGRVLSSICDPYLNWFRRFRFTRIGMVDFSPILSLGILSITAQLITSILATGTISLWAVVVSIIQLIWSFVSFILNLLIIFLIIRLGYDLFGSSNSSPFSTKTSAVSYSTDIDDYPYTFTPHCAWPFFRFSGVAVPSDTVYVENTTDHY